MGDMVFVFGSNLAGRHGKGAAKYAMDHYGAEYGVGIGPTGESYAIPTKDKNLHVLPLHIIERYISEFLEYAANNNRLTFQLTPIGCGLAGYKRSDIWAILKRQGITENVLMSSTWVTYAD